MPLPVRPRLTVPTPAASARMARGFAAIRTELAVPADFPPAVLAEAAAATPAAVERTDAPGIALVTIDPPGSVDLDQALHIERRSGRPGYRVRYAIADVAAFVAP